MTTNTTTGLTQNQLIQELAKNILTDKPVRIVMVDDTRNISFRIDGVEIINDEVILVVDNYQA